MDARLSIEYELADVPRCLRPAAALTLFPSPRSETISNKDRVGGERRDPRTPLGAPHNWGGPALPWRRVRCCCGTSKATDVDHSNYKSKLIAYLARKSKIPLSKHILFAAFHCLLAVLYLRNIHCVQLGIEDRGRMRKFRVILYNEVRTNLSLKEDTALGARTRARPEDKVYHRHIGV